MAEQLIDFDALAEQMRATNKQIEELTKLNRENSKKVFQAAISGFFKAYPEVGMIRWTQYTPYFNDGEACEFSVGTPAFFFAGQDPEEIEDTYEYNAWNKPSKWMYEEAKNGGKYAADYQAEIDKYDNMVKALGPRLKEIQEGIRKFQELFNDIEDGTMLGLFGDHVQVSATANGIDIDEYDHE